MRRSRGRGNNGQSSGNNNNNNSGNSQPRRTGSIPNRHQVFDSNGPEVRIRGNAFQVYEKYQALARDATSSGDRVKVESYLQHAEHYYRIYETYADSTNNSDNQNQRTSRQQDSSRDTSNEDQPSSSANMTQAHNISPADKNNDEIPRYGNDEPRASDEADPSSDQVDADSSDQTASREQPRRRLRASDSSSRSTESARRREPRRLSSSPPVTATEASTTGTLSQPVDTSAQMPKVASSVDPSQMPQPTVHDYQPIKKNEAASV